MRQGPTLRERGVVRWRRTDLAQLIEQRFGVTLAERSIGSLLRRLGFRRLSVRPRHPEKDLAAQEAFKKRFLDLVAQSIPPHGRDKPIEIWWQDEARVGQQGTLTRVWAERGSRPPAPRDRRYDWAYLFGAACPARATAAALVLLEANTEGMSLHLLEISRDVAIGAHAVVVLDGAGWHKIGARLRLPDNISLLLLPFIHGAQSGREHLLQQNHLSNRVFDTYSTIVDACCDAWKALVAVPDRIGSIATRDWASVNG